MTTNAHQIRQLENEQERLRKELRQLESARQAAVCTPEQERSIRARSIDLARTMDAVERTLPEHAFYCPNQLFTISRSLMRAGQWLKEGMHESALATLQMCETQLRLLVLRVYEADKRWKTLFEAYAGAVQECLQALQTAHSHAVQTSAGTFQADEACMDYYSSGLYRAVLERLEAIRTQMLLPYEQHGNRAFEGAPTEAQLILRLNEVDDLRAHTQGALYAYQKEMLCADERETVGEELAQMLAAQGCTAVAHGFAQNDALKEYCVSGDFFGSAVSIKAAPVRADGVAEDTVILLECADELIGQAWLQRIRQSVPGKKIINGKQSGLLANSKNHADPYAYVRLLKTRGIH